jgi:hypothetical protein
MRGPSTDGSPTAIGEHIGERWGRVSVGYPRAMRENADYCRKPQPFYPWRGAVTVKAAVVCTPSHGG